MPTLIHDAVYRDEILEEFRYNPLIEALPAPLEPGDAIIRLMIRPPYSDGERSCPSSYRQLLTQRIVRLHQPMEREVDVFGRIDRCIRWGYADRNPLSPAYTAQLAAGHAAAISGNGLNYTGGYHPHTYGFSILGISGVGKSTTVESILSLYPQVIRHTAYQGLPLDMHQISWLKLDCACDGSLKGLCTDFFREIDELLGTSYSAQYHSRRVTLDQMMVAMSRLCVSHNIGVIIIDEIQNLCSAQKGVPEKVLNFFVTLVNTVGVPVIMIGTPKALSILQNEFQQAKRGSGQGDALWERMGNDASWDLFCRAIWTYQYTKKVVPFSSGMKNALYDEAQGIPFLAVHIYKLVQEAAMLSGEETFSAKDLHRIATEKMGLTKPMREAMKAGKEVDLKKYVDITPFSYSDYKDNYSIATEVKNPAAVPPKQVSTQEAAAVTLMGLGLSYSEASSFVCAALAEDRSGCLAAPVIARKAYQMYLSGMPAAEPDCSQLAGLSGYDSLEEAGLIADEAS